MGNETAIWLQIVTLIFCFVLGLIGMICLFINGFTLWAHLALVGLVLYTISAFLVLGGLVG